MRPESSIALVAAIALSTACTAVAPPAPGARLGALPDRGAVLYSVSAEAVLLSYETSALRGRHPGQQTQITETDHRQVIRVAPDGRALVINDYHQDGRHGTYVRWSSGDRIRTVRLLPEPQSLTQVALCGSRTVVYAAGTGNMPRDLPGAIRPVGGSIQPELLECSRRGQIATLDAAGELMLGSAAGLATVDPEMRFSAMQWSPDGSRLAACTLGGELVLLSADGSVRSTVARIDRPCDVAWSPDERRLAFTYKGRLLVVCSCGGAPRALSEDLYAVGPVWSPTGSAIAYGEAFAGVRAVVLSTGRSAAVAEDGVPLAWLDTAGTRRAAALADSYPCC
jgi:hypothetical protein